MEISFEIKGKGCYLVVGNWYYVDANGAENIGKFAGIVNKRLSFKDRDKNQFLVDREKVEKITKIATCRITDNIFIEGDVVNLKTEGSEYRSCTFLGFRNNEIFISRSYGFEYQKDFKIYISESDILDKEIQLVQPVSIEELKRIMSIS